MASFEGIRRAVRVHGGALGVRRAIEDEIAFHLDSRVADLRRHGHSEDDARLIALREFGDLTTARRELEAIDRRASHRRGWLEWWADLQRDISLGARSMRRQPATTAAIVITLALGIGANGAIYTVLQAALLAPLPYHRADRLVHIWQTHAPVHDRTEASFPDFVDWRAGTRALSQLEGYDPTNVTIVGGDRPDMIRGGRVSAGFFSLLGVTPVLGRTFTPRDDEPGASPVVVLDHGSWRRRFGGDREVIGRPLSIDGSPHVIVGVLPAGFHFAPAGAAELWLPLGRSAATRADRRDRWLNVVGRLRDGATPGTAQAEVASVMRRLASRHPETNAGRSAVVVPLREEVVGDVRPLLLVLASAATLVLVIACANVAGLLLARSLARTREMAVRSALGATRARLVRQLLTESTMLALAGGVMAVAVASAGAHVLLAAIPDGTRSGMPFWSETGTGVSAAAIRFTIVVAFGAVIAFGLGPALLASRATLGDLLRRGGRGMAGSGRGRARDTLVAAEIALTVVLLVGTGLLVRSLVGLLRLDPGFRAEEVMTARVALAGPRYASGEARGRFFDDLLARIRESPGVEAAGAVSHLPLNGGGTNAFQVVGAAERPVSERMEATVRAVAGDYFEAMRIRLVEGRQFTSRDDSTSPPVIIINASLARQLFGSGRAVASRVRFDAFPGQEWEIVGVVGDVTTTRLDAAASPTVYYPNPQAPENRLSLAVRTACTPGATGGDVASGQCRTGALAALIRRAVAALDPALPVYSMATMEQQVTDSPAVFARRYPLLLVGLFAATALALAVVGLYGVISYGVVRRTREFGVRMALGAAPRAIRGAVLRHGLALAACGVAVGVPMAFALTRGLQSMLYRVQPADLTTYLTACGVLACVALVASYVPARRATRIEPTAALRAD
jgi:predicted permease